MAGGKLRVSEVQGSGQGYFKLQPVVPPAVGADGRWQVQRAPLLIVAFGSAPGTPNWGGLLARLDKVAGGGLLGSSGTAALVHMVTSSQRCVWTPTQHIWGRMVCLHQLDPSPAACMPRRVLYVVLASWPVCRALACAVRWHDRCATAMWCGSTQQA
jgi:hypothetical protein